MLEMMNLSGASASPSEEGNIKKFGAGGTGIGVLTKSGNLYTIGDNYFSGTGGKTTTWRLLSANVEDFWISYRSLLIRTVDNRWLFMGQNRYFDPGFNTTITSLTDVTAYMQLPSGSSIKSLCLGAYAIAVVLNDGRYAMCGSNSTGGLGTGNTTASTGGLAFRSDFTNVKKIELDWYNFDTSYMLLENGDVYVTGSSIYGQGGVSNQTLNAWRLQTRFSGPVVDIIPGTRGFFRIVDQTNGKYAIYAQGQQSTGSLGTGDSGSSKNSPVSLFTDLNLINGQLPTLNIGYYSARLQHPNGKLYFTGTGTGNLQGTGVGFQTTYLSFTEIPNVPYGGEYYATRGNYDNAYFLKSGLLYGVGSATNYLLPGYTSTLLSFMPLDISELV